MDMAETEKTTYLVGLYDGLLAATLLDAPDSSVKKLEDCLPGLTGKQLLAITEKFLRDHPERWGEPMNGLFWASLPQTCRA